MLAEGANYFGRFTILSVLGTGGFAVTYLAVDISLQKKFAIKEYFPSGFAVSVGNEIQASKGCEDEYQWGLQRFLEEARILARFNHPNIVGVNQIFEANGTAYIILEYQSGLSLKAWLAQLTTQPNQAELDYIMLPLLDALKLLHRNNVLHRDIAPDNIYIRNDGSPVLLDFGSAREAISIKTKTFTATVKDGYSPIEQYSNAGTSQGPWTDIYSLAATIYFSLTKAPPPAATDRIITDQLISLKMLGLSGYRETFLEALQSALNIHPKNRPQTVEQWLEHLVDDRDRLRPHFHPETKTRTKLNLKIISAALILPLILIPVVYALLQRYFPEKQTEKLSDRSQTINRGAQLNQGMVSDVEPKQNQRSVMLIEAPGSEARVKTILGTTEWNLKKGSPQISLNANINFKDIGTASIRIIHNEDKRLSATHLIEIRFDFDAQSEISGIKAIDIPQMRLGDRQTGDPLAGIQTPVSKNFYLIGLTNMEPQASRNSDLLKSGEWIDVPILLMDGRLAKLTVEKGSQGSLLLNELLQSKPQTKR